MRLFGRDRTLNDSSLLLFSLFVDTIFGNLKKLTLFERQNGIYRECRRTFFDRGEYFAETSQVLEVIGNLV